MKKHMLIIMVAAMMLLPLSSVMAVEVHYASTELNYWDPDKTEAGYTVFTPFMQPAGQPVTTYMINMQGEVVHSFGSQYGAGLYAYLTEEGTFMRGGNVRYQGENAYLWSGGGGAGRVEELDWDGNLIWGMDWNGPDHIQHHDFIKIFNKELQTTTYLVMEWIRKSADDALALGANPDYVDDELLSKDPGAQDWSPCGIVEILPNANGEGGEVIWRWSFTDHLLYNSADGFDTSNVSAVAFDDVRGITNAPAIDGVPAEHPEKLYINWHTPYGYGPQVDWNHCNSFDYNAETGHIAINAKHMSEFYVFDHDSTFVSDTDWDANIAAARGDDGDFLYRWGNPSVYDQGVAPEYHESGDQQMWASHDIQYIQDAHYTGGPALPGAGNFLIFDNGTWNPESHRSVILEIDPYVSDRVVDSETGEASYTVEMDFVNPPDAGYYMEQRQTAFTGVTDKVSNQVPWRYLSGMPQSFFGSFISGCQRMPNGNTVICSGPTGHFFEVTEDGEVVWEYLNPINMMGPQLRQTSSNSQLFMTFRTYRYNADYPGLAGRELTPTGTITGRLPGGVGQGDSYPTVEIPPAPTGWGTSGLTTGEGGGGGAGGGTGGGGTGY
jgi:Arylsulfotransferase (ASST)